MKTIEVFDPAMCCSTGVCGTTVDPDLARFAADVDWLASAGVSVSRYNLAQQPAAFANRDVIRSLLAEKGEKCLPVVLADGEVVSEGAYPDRASFASMAGADLGLSAPSGTSAPVSCCSPSTEATVAAPVAKGCC